jgi:hypothetical protein
MGGDAYCLIHGLKHSEHHCLFCCLCFKTLTVEECHVGADGVKEDICVECAEMEEKVMAEKRSKQGEQS